MILSHTGCSLNIVFFSKILKYIPDSGLSRFPLSVNVCTQWQVKHRRRRRTCRIQKNHNILGENTILNKYPVYTITRSTYDDYNYSLVTPIKGDKQKTVYLILSYF